MYARPACGWYGTRVWSSRQALASSRQEWESHNLETMFNEVASMFARWACSGRPCVQVLQLQLEEAKQASLRELEQKDTAMSDIDRAILQSLQQESLRVNSSLAPGARPALIVRVQDVDADDDLERAKRLSRVEAGPVGPAPTPQLPLAIRRCVDMGFDQAQVSGAAAHARATLLTCGAQAELAFTVYCQTTSDPDALLEAMVAHLSQ